MLEWNVYIEDWNNKTIKKHNIFDHYSFMEDCKRIAKKFDEIDEFEIQIKRSLMYYYWSKCEWEIVLCGLFSRDDFDDEKIDVYDQVMMNWDRFIDYLWENRTELKRRKVKVKK